MSSAEVDGTFLARRTSSSSGTSVKLTSRVTANDVDDDVCAEIKLSPDGRWLLAPNRALPASGCCSVAVFAVGTSGDGALSLSEICVIQNVRLLLLVP